MSRTILALALSGVFAAGALQAQTPTYLDPDQPVDARARDLVPKMTLEEKVSQMIHDAAAIERLQVPEYDWWNECLHGVGRAGQPCFER